jgi:hypothetical protein
MAKHCGGLVAAAEKGMMNACGSQLASTSSSPSTNLHESHDRPRGANKWLTSRITQQQLLVETFTSEFIIHNADY